MKKKALALLYLSALLAACDSSNETAGGGEATEQDSTSSLISDTASVVKDATEKTSEELDSALESAKNAADSLAESAQESASAAVEKSDEVIASVSGQDAGTGESIYKTNCIACHGSGVAGAPKLGDQAAWTARIAQGHAVLSQHAIEGYKGAAGYMPPKGGYMKLSDEEVSLAVQYMVSQVQ
jgi:cytochrome c5